MRFTQDYKLTEYLPISIDDFLLNYLKYKKVFNFIFHFKYNKNKYCHCKVSLLLVLLSVIKEELIDVIIYLKISRKVYGSGLGCNYHSIIITCVICSNRKEKKITELRY